MSQFFQTYDRDRLYSHLSANEAVIKEWFLKKAQGRPVPIYGSVDLRDSLFKCAPVDHNLFPAGFNNICPKDQRNAAPVFRSEIERIFSSCLKQPCPKRIAILPEENTRNTFYLENIYFLRSILEEAGFEVQVAWMPQEDPLTLTLNTASGNTIEAHSLIRNHDSIQLHGGFTPDLILLNNDFSSGRPAFLENLKQPIVPSFELGWYARQKSRFFDAYNRLATDFAETLSIDPWLFTLETRKVENVDLDSSESVDQLVSITEDLLSHLKQAYEAREITATPVAFIKSNQGTYGMGVTSVRSGEELRTWNRRMKNKMSVGKNRLRISSVIIQEGIPTATLVNEYPAEPVIYLTGLEPIGGFIRSNTEKSNAENLNSTGMIFKKLCMSDLDLLLDSSADLDREAPENRSPKLELIYGTLARLAALASSFEL